MKAVIYARYSSSGQREESIEGQIRECTEYAERNGMTVVKVYEDKALTGRTDRRPGFQQMIKDSDRHQFEAVICWKTDRFARNRYDAAIYKARLRKNGVRLCYARESIPEGAEGIILESIMEGYAEYYSANLSENVKRGNYESALKHQTLGKRVLGYRKASDGTFEIDPDMGWIIKRIFDEFDSGRTMFQIFRGLNEDGLKTASGGNFNKSSLRRILSNEKYKGVYRFMDICDEDAIPALVSKEQFDRVQQKLAKSLHNPKNRNGIRFAMTSKLFCGHCGSAMVGDSATNPSGETYYWYTCNGRRSHICQKKREPKDDLEKMIARHLMDILADQSLLEAIADRCMEILEDDTDPELDGLKASLATIERKIANLLKALADGLNYDSVKKAISDLEEDKKKTEQAIARKNIERPKLTRESILLMLDRLRTGDVDSAVFRDRLFETFLNAVFLYDDGTVILHLNLGGDDQDPASFSFNESVREKDRQACHVYHSRTMSVCIIRPDLCSVIIKASR